MKKLSRLILSIMIGLLVLPLLAVKADLPEMCHSIPTHYNQLRSGWLWQDADTVFFSVHPGNYGSAIFSNPVMWYAYHPSTDELIELPLNPYFDVLGASVPPESLLFIPKNKWGSYEDVSVSPTGKQFVYPEYDPKTAKTSYWYDDRETGLHVKLDINPKRYNGWKITWRADGRQFVFHPFYGLPIYVVTIQSAQAVVQRLTDIPSLAWLAEAQGIGAFLTMKGISPDGRYILTQPEITGISWLIIWDEARDETLNFSLYEAEGMVWLNNTTFVAKTNLGIIEYDIAQRKMKIRPTTELLNHVWGHLSPDGGFIIGEYWEGSYLLKEFVICRVG